jgi:ligand-binding SRPBCC domain-containing protein
MSKVYSLKTVQTIPVPVSEAWNFFSNPTNLPKITPPNMKFKVISKHHGEKMYAGQIIEYKVAPLLNLDIYWMTEITQVVDQQYFIDEQRYGPYSLWHHQHHFKETEAGTEMTDIVHYKIPFWFAGDIANSLFVKKQLEGIFSYRKKAIEEIFG